MVKKDTEQNLLKISKFKKWAINKTKLFVWFSLYVWVRERICEYVCAYMLKMLLWAEGDEENTTDTFYRI